MEKQKFYTDIRMSSDNKLMVLADVQVLADAAAQSKFFPGIQSPTQALILMALAQAEGMAPVQAMQRYDVIQGRPAKKAQAMLSDFLSAGGKVQWHEHSDKVAEATFSHPQGGEIRVRWDMDKAKNAGLLGKDNWKKHPEAMLHARCVSNGVRFVYPAATGGMYDPTEVADFDVKVKPPKSWETLHDTNQPVDAKFAELQDGIGDLSEQDAILKAIAVAETADHVRSLKPRIATLRGSEREDCIQAATQRIEELRRDEEIAKMDVPVTVGEP